MPRDRDSGEGHLKKREKENSLQSYQNLEENPRGEEGQEKGSNPLLKNVIRKKKNLLGGEVGICRKKLLCARVLH